MTLRVWDLETGRQLSLWGPFENETDTCAIDLDRHRACSAATMVASASSTP